MSWALLGAMCAAGSGLVLLAGGWWKLTRRAAFTLVLREHGRWASTNAGWLTPVLGGIEFTVGLSTLALALPPESRTGIDSLLWLPTLGMTALGVFFAGYAWSLLARGRAPRCGCLNSHDQVGPHTVARAVVIAASGVGGWLSVGIGGDTPSPTLWVGMVLAGSALMAAVLLIGVPAVTPEATPRKRKSP